LGGGARDRFEDPRETAVKSDVKIKTRFTIPRDPRGESGASEESGEGRRSGIYTWIPTREMHGEKEGDRNGARAKIRERKKEKENQATMGDGGLRLVEGR
jgi:hypothetical protein